MSEQDVNGADAAFLRRVGAAMDEAIANSTWKPPPVDVEPRVVLRMRQVIEVEGRGRHFVGDTGWDGRVSGTILAWDPATQSGQTKSGRVYQLRGSPGLSRDARYVRARWLAREGEPAFKDVSGEYAAPNGSRSPTP